MEFQIFTDKQLPKIGAGRSWITFHFRKEIEDVRAGIVDRKTNTGTMKVSSPELTALDLLRYARIAGGIGAIATIIADLADCLDSSKLALLAPHFERAPLQRLGYLLDWLGHGDRAQALHDYLAEEGVMPWVDLEPRRSKNYQTEVSPIERNERWHIVIRRRPEIDE